MPDRSRAELERAAWERFHQFRGAVLSRRYDGRGRPTTSEGTNDSATDPDLRRLLDVTEDAFAQVIAGATDEALARIAGPTRPHPRER